SLAQLRMPTVACWSRMFNEQQSRCGYGWQANQPSLKLRSTGQQRRLANHDILKFSILRPIKHQPSPRFAGATAGKPISINKNRVCLPAEARRAQEGHCDHSTRAFNARS
ncbi:hypothetical protein KJ652_06460, partial [Patescibacteria group bacterium]|nr:hypothetical protein [Patescibacteria group bacterium]